MRAVGPHFAASAANAPVLAPPPVDTCREPVFPYVAGEATNETLSVGDTSNGRVVNAKALAENEALAILPKQKARDLAFGSEELVGLLEHAGAELHRATGTRLWVGDVGKRGGGDIPFSVSHNAGRDADVALSYLDGSGKPIDPPDLVPLGKDGVSKDGSLRLDPERTWITVRALVTAPGAHVEYIFLSEPLKKKILKFAREHGEKPSVMERAAEVLRQPAGAAPHDDHLHVRTYCTARDLGAGCVDTGTPRPLRADDVSTRKDRVDRAVAMLRAGEPLDRVRAILRLALMDEKGHLDDVAKLLDDPSPNVRHAAVTATAELGSAADVSRLAKRFATETEPAVREQILLASAILGGADAGKVLADAIVAGEDAVPASAPPPHAQAVEAPRPVDLVLGVDLLDGASLASPLPRRAPSVQAFAIALAGRADRIEPVPALIALLGSRDDALRASAAESLALVTNQRFGEKWGAGADTSACEEAKKRYEALWKKLAKSPRDAWIALGFTTAGFKVRALDEASVWELVRATAAEPHLSYNAREVLARIAGEPTRGALGPADAACSYYLRLFQERRRFHVDKPPSVVQRACALLKRT